MTKSAIKFVAIVILCLLGCAALGLVEASQAQDVCGQSKDCVERFLLVH